MSPLRVQPSTASFDHFVDPANLQWLAVATDGEMLSASKPDDGGNDLRNSLGKAFGSLACEEAYRDVGPFMSRSGYDKKQREDSSLCVIIFR